MDENLGSKWPVKADSPPNLSDKQWALLSIIGAIFIIAALAQIINIRAFTDNLAAIGLTHANFWAGLIILAELWASATFFKIRLSTGFRKASMFFAGLVSGFWLYESIRTAAESAEGTSLSANFFGRFLKQTPGWWTIIEATVFLFLVMWGLDVLKKHTARTTSGVKVTRARR